MFKERSTSDKKKRSLLEGLFLVQHLRKVARNCARMRDRHLFTDEGKGEVIKFRRYDVK